MVEEYRGLRIGAEGNAHQRVAEILSRELPRSARVLDIAAGSGALTARLHDLGFERIVANEIDEARFELREFECLRIELNSPRFAEEIAGSFEAILAVEVIEHLENPAGFLRNCKALLVPGGIIIGTTPNVGSWLSRLQMLRAGSPRWFGARDLAVSGHMSPIFSWTLRHHAEASGLLVRSITYTDNDLLRQQVDGMSMRTRLFKPKFVNRRLVSWMGPESAGELMLYVLERRASTDTV